MMLRALKQKYVDSVGAEACQIPFNVSPLYSNVLYPQTVSLYVCKSPRDGVRKEGYCFSSSHRASFSGRTEVSRIHS